MRLLFSGIAFFITFFFSSTAFCQENNLLTKEDWNTILPAINNSKWEEAEKITFEILNRFKSENEMSDEAGIIRYMYIRCIAAQIGEKIYEKEEGLKKLNGFEGKNIITPPIMFKAKGMFNYFSLPSEGDAQVWRQCCTNKNATVLYSFEAYEPKDISLIKDSNKYEGKYLRLSAVIKEINVGGSAMPRLDIVFKDMVIVEILK
mgnify:CR=1 FL=1